VRVIAWPVLCFSSSELCLSMLFDKDDGGGIGAVGKDRWAIWAVN